jgi:hypothetical protein
MEEYRVKLCIKNGLIDPAHLAEKEKLSRLIEKYWKCEIT